VDLDRVEEFPAGHKGIISFAHRMLLPGATQRACQTSRCTGKANWRRYMHDHASKAKQHQIPVDIGRHWGIINRKAYVQSVPSEVTTLSHEQYYRVLRWLQRLSTPRVPDARAPFGRRSGYTVKRGRFGKTIWFTQPETVQRMIQLAVDGH
jgi:hypothetical protein